MAGAATSRTRREAAAGRTAGRPKRLAVAASRRRRTRPDALVRLLAQVAAEQTIDISGPKLLLPRRRRAGQAIAEIGVSISGTGRRELLIDPGEIDQGQRDVPRSGSACPPAGCSSGPRYGASSAASIRHFPSSATAWTGGARARGRLTRSHLPAGRVHPPPGRSGWFAARQRDRAAAGQTRSWSSAC